MYTTPKTHVSLLVTIPYEGDNDPHKQLADLLGKGDHMTIEEDEPEDWLTVTVERDFESKRHRHIPTSVFDPDTDEIDDWQWQFELIPHSTVKVLDYDDPYED